VSERESRSILYRARLDRLRELMLFLVKDCCGGRSELCAAVIADLTPLPAESARREAGKSDVLLFGYARGRASRCSCVAGRAGDGARCGFLG